MWQTLSALQVYVPQMGTVPQMGKMIKAALLDSQMETTKNEFWTFHYTPKLFSNMQKYPPYTNF